MIDKHGAVEEHFCANIENFPLDRFFQSGIGYGKNVLIIGESPAENGWRKSGKAFYSPEGKLLATGKRLNELLAIFDLDVSNCGFTELSKCFVGTNRKILGNCCKKCWPICEKQITKEDSRLIITRGVIPAQIMGEILNSKIIMGELTKLFIAGITRTLLPLYHPSPANPNGREKNRMIVEKYRDELKSLII